VGVFLAILGAIAVAILKDEVKAWLCWAARKITLYAASRAPEKHRERLAEEWSRDLEDTPGSLLKLLNGCGFAFATIRMRRQMCRPAPFRQFTAKVVAVIFNLPWPPFPQSQMGRMFGDLICLVSLGRIRCNSAMKIVAWISIGKGSCVGDLLFILWLIPMFTGFAGLTVYSIFLFIIVWSIFRITPLYGLLR
jgi:hypothetical protein